MFDELVDLINEKKIKVTNKTGRAKLSKILKDKIDLEGWDKSVKEIIKVFKKQTWDNLTIQIILSHWQENGDLDSIFVILVKYYLISNEDAKWLFERLELSDLENILKKSIELNDNQNYHILANNLINLYSGDESFTDLDGNQYINLLNYVKDFQEKTQHDCKNIINFYNFKKSQYVYALVPDWVSIEEGENLSLLMTLNPGKSYEDVEHIVEKLVKKSKDYFYVKEGEGNISLDIEEALINYLKASSLEENPDIDHQANRVFGPANRFPDKNCVSNPNKNGPCRMLECLCCELDSENDYNYVLYEWFTGICDNFDCSKKIRDRSHCVRIPVEGGGWKGCFCSFDCMDKAILFRDKDTNFRIEYMKNALFEDGIMDRTKT